ncbi:MAG: acyl-CoA dehydrogenase family protein [Shewanellaceae bacterium]|nr:acyl-CoA dehydrogenase family protein [Shewanellaceae bacterium]
MDFQPTPEQLDYIGLATKFCQTELEPHAAQWDKMHYFPEDVIKRAGQLGFCSLYTDAQYGGMGLSRLDSVLIFETLARGCTATTAMLTIHNMVTWLVTTYGQADFVQAWAPTLVTGQTLASYCLTEPHAGSDAAALTTLAERCDDGYRLSGSKAFISGAGATDLLVVIARTSADAYVALAVPANTPGVSYGQLEQKMGWLSQPTRTVHFDDVRLPRYHRLAEEGKGFQLAMNALNGGRLNIAACSLGTAQAALEQTQHYVLERQQFKRSLGDFQSVQFKFADMVTELSAARQLLYYAAWKLDHDTPDKAAFCAMAKRYVTDIGFEVCNAALQLHGGYGYLKDYPFERYVRDTRVHQILEGTNEIMRLIIAKYWLQNHRFVG